MSESVNGSNARWAGRAMQMVPGLKPRPQHHCVGEKNGVKNISSDDSSLFVFINNCQDFEYNINGKVGKVTAENCRNLTLNISHNVVGGTLEIIRCENLSLNYGVNAEIPVLQIECSTNISIYIWLKSQLQSVYLMQTRLVNLYLQNQVVDDQNGLTLQYSIETPDDELHIQKVSHWSSALPDANFITECVVRDGVFPTTSEMKKAAEGRRELMKHKMSEMLLNGIKITKPNQGDFSGLSSKDKNFDLPD
ncbi:uncharacterized protein LOC100204168 [Hydra vulgaris]|uniref:uncharacterized protein LOC100204168 n=1 Tax=Hydra vulgaris TaxID=6087 RepID=UPI0001925C84|nr:uncharacterized protein LOC100204168 [Hydra vulgaris]